MWDHQPLSIVEDKGFVAYSKMLNSNYELPSRKTISTNMLDEHYNQLNETTRSPGWLPGNPIVMNEIPFAGTPGISPNILQDNSPLDYFNICLNINLLNLIIECTNKYGKKLKDAANTPRARFRKWIDLTMNEFKTFLGILLLMGTIKLNRMVDYWSTNYLLRLSPRLFMPRDRFQLILRALNVQRSTRNQSIFKIKSLIDLFNNNMDTIYSPSKKLCIDESLILWKGRLSFRQYMKGKAHKYEIKLYILADENGIVLKIHVYAGAADQLVGGRNDVQKVVMLLMDKFINKGHSLYMDNYYNSVTLCNELLEKKTYVTGTLRGSRVGNPLEVITAKINTGESAIMHNEKVVVTKWKDKREISFISSEHKSDYKGTVSRRSRTIKYKPAVQIKYNFFMRSIDEHDQMLSYYTCEHKSIRWYKKVILHVIQICLVNSWLLYKKENRCNMPLYDFRKSIIEKLLPPNSGSTELSRTLSDGKIHLPMHLPKRQGRIVRKRCRLCYAKTKKRVDVIFGCPDCPEFPGLCLECFREFHDY